MSAPLSVMMFRFKITGFDGLDSVITALIVIAVLAVVIGGAIIVALTVGVTAATVKYGVEKPSVEIQARLWRAGATKEPDKKKAELRDMSPSPWQVHLIIWAVMIICGLLKIIFIFAK